jgi:archaellum biogenesis ATPase FlaH
MTSQLTITSVEKLQSEITNSMKLLKGMIGIYISLNKTQASTEELLRKQGIQTENIFFVDCVTTEKTRDDVLHISPDSLDTLSQAITDFIKDINGDKFLIIDALSTLLIYNNENKVAKYTKEVTDLASRHGVTFLAFSPKTQGEELLDKIFNFFDKVEKK